MHAAFFGVDDLIKEIIKKKNLPALLTFNDGIKVTSKEDWEKRNFTPFYKNVKRDGILLWD